MVTCPSGHRSASGDFCDVCGIRIGESVLRPVDPGEPGRPAGDGSPGRRDREGAAGEETVAEVCPRCGVPREGRFCECCGWNFAGGAVPVGPPSPWPDAPPATAPQSVPAPESLPEPPPPPVTEPPVPEPLPAPVPVSAVSVPAPSPPQDDGARATWSVTITADREYYDAVQGATGADASHIDFPSCYPERRVWLTGDQARIGRRSASRGIEPEIDLSGPPADPGVSRLHAVLVVAPDGTWSVVDPGSANGTLVNGSEIRPDEPVPLREGDRVNLGAWTLLVLSRGN
ncbi:MAG: FHA domain-containing protein [Nocardiopsaceae bacterium]|nr:FHA domain-containing protein [Nocardiopsaceae bacterium]